MTIRVRLRAHEKSIMNGILLLNANMTPLQTIPLKRAVSLLSKGAVDVIEAFPDKFLRSAHTSQPFPAVLRLKYFVNVPRRKMTWSRRAVFTRDRYVCQYCGKRLEKDEAELEHIIPREECAKIGVRPSTWSNTTTACRRCNSRKANKNMRDAGMKFFFENYEPKTPRTSYLIVGGEVPSVWKKYLEV